MTSKHTIECLLSFVGLANTTNTSTDLELKLVTKTPVSRELSEQLLDAVIFKKKLTVIIDIKD